MFWLFDIGTVHHMPKYYNPFLSCLLQLAWSVCWACWRTDWLHNAFQGLIPPTICIPFFIFIKETKQSEKNDKWYLCWKKFSMLMWHWVGGCPAQESMGQWCLWGGLHHCALSLVLCEWMGARAAWWGDSLRPVGSASAPCFVHTAVIITWNANHSLPLLTQAPTGTPPHSHPNSSAVTFIWQVSGWGQTLSWPQSDDTPQPVQVQAPFITGQCEPIPEVLTCWPTWWRWPIASGLFNLTMQNAPVLDSVSDFFQIYAEKQLSD